MVVALKTHRFTREEYDRMVETGILTTDDKVELIEGEILAMSPQNGPYATATRLAQKTLEGIFGPGHDVRAQFPLALEADSEPEPDLAVVAGSPRDYRTRHPETALLVVEVAETSLTFDRTVKQSLYARSGIPEYWIINLRDRQVEVFRGPAASGYRSLATYTSGQSFSPAGQPAARVVVDDLLP